MAEVQDVYVCSPVAWGDPAVPSVMLVCSSCQQSVWASARMRNDPKIRDMETMCIPCAAKRMDVEGVANFEIHPIAAAELRDFIEGKPPKEGKA